MKTFWKLLRTLLIYSTIVLAVSCTTTPSLDPIRVPAFTAPAPQRPILEDIPQDASGAIRSLTRNLSALVAYIEKIELYDEIKTAYYKQVIKVLEN
jgi:hypothetical protein